MKSGSSNSDSFLEEKSVTEDLTAGEWAPPSKANGYRAVPIPLAGMPTPPLREVQKLPKKQRALEVLRRLKLMYPQAPCSLDHESPVQLMVATILSAQCTDARVNMVTPALFERFPDAEAIAHSDIDELEELIRSTGFYRSKSKNIRAACQKLITEFGGEMPQSMAELTTLSGVARKTANVVLAHAFDIHEGVTVDTHVNQDAYSVVYKVTPSLVFIFINHVRVSIKISNSDTTTSPQP